MAVEKARGGRRFPFWLRRPLLVARGMRVNRKAPDLEHLEGIVDPEEFIWAVLPYAARSFAASILLLPEEAARTCAVAYLYARMLDTYEDLSPSPAEAQRSLEAFAARFLSDPLTPAIDSPPSGPVASSDKASLLLLRRHDLVDRVFLGLTGDDRERIVQLIERMSSGMVDYSRVFHRQGGVLDDSDQVAEYCHRVIGFPVLFVLETLFGEVSADHRRHALKVSELIQLANITRDVEKDLQFGVAYHPRLRPHLGSDGRGAAQSAVLQARKDLLVMATRRAASFRYLLNEHALPSFSLARPAAVVMMLFTDRHYRRVAVSVGLTDWRGPRSLVSMFMTSLPALWSARWAERVLRRAEEGLLTYAHDRAHLTSDGTLSGSVTFGEEPVDQQMRSWPGRH